MSCNQFKKVVVGERQMFRRIKKEKQKIVMEIHQAAGALGSALQPSSRNSSSSPQSSK